VQKLATHVRIQSGITAPVNRWDDQIVETKVRRASVNLCDAIWIGEVSSAVGPIFNYVFEI
jgi:hypothetical protein